MSSERRNDAVPHNTEDKSWWLRHGEVLEKRFVQFCVQELGLAASINPAKAADPTAPDLVVNGQLADLKVQNTPFFSAGRYGLDPRFTVTFNRKDYERYAKLYPALIIFFWADWKQLEWRDSRVAPLSAIYQVPFATIAAKIKGGTVPEHAYQRRVGDRAGNAKSSFLLDLREFALIADFTAPNSQR
jgi:hypothetical protein